MRALREGLTITLVTLALAAGVSELALRVMFARSLDFGLEMWKYASHLKQPVDNERLRFVHRPGARETLMGVDVQISSQGYRDREFTVEKPAGTYRVLMLGDSTCFGWGAPAADTVAKRLERELNAAPGGGRYEVINTGVGNYGTVQEVESYLTRGRTFHPDLVLLLYFINDAERVPPVASSLLGEHSYLRAFVASRYDGVLRLTGRRPGWQEYYRSLYDEAAPGWQSARRALHDLAGAARSDGARLAVALLPELHQLNGGSYPFARAHQMVSAEVSADGVPVIELIDALRDRGPESELWVTPLDAHPNARAASLAAAMLADWVRRNAGAAVPGPGDPAAR